LLTQTHRCGERARAWMTSQSVSLWRHRCDVDMRLVAHV